MTNRVHIGPMTFESDGSTGLVYTSLRGWTSGAPMRAVVEDRPNSDGAFDVNKDYRAARIITFEGGLFGSSHSDAELNFYDQFAALQATGEPILFQVERDWGTRSAYVSIMDVAEVEELGDGAAALVNVQLVARDPIKYGPSTMYTTGLPTAGGGLEYNLFSGGAGGALYYGANGTLGRVDVANSGTADVWPTFSITGALTAGFYIQNLTTGAILRYDRVVPAGSTVSLNARTGEVLVDGLSDGSTYLTTANWFAIPAGSTATIQFNAIGGSSGTPQMTVTAPAGFW